MLPNDANKSKKTTSLIKNITISNIKKSLDIKSKIRALR